MTSHTLYYITILINFLAISAYLVSYFIDYRFKKKRNKGLNVGWYKLVKKDKGKYLFVFYSDSKNHPDIRACEIEDINIRFNTPHHLEYKL